MALFPIWVGKKTILFPESFYRSLLIFDFLSKFKSVTEKGFPSSLHYAGQGEKGTSVFDSRS